MQNAVRAVSYEAMNCGIAPDQVYCPGEGVTTINAGTSAFWGAFFEKELSKVISFGKVTRSHKLYDVILEKMTL